MENEDKKEIISDEELKNVSGGEASFGAGIICGRIRNAKDCMMTNVCVWSNGVCKLR